VCRRGGPEGDPDNAKKRKTRSDPRAREDRFWVPYRNKTARQVAATLRHIRGKAIDMDEFILQEEVDELPHEEHVRFEQERMTRCTSYLKGLLLELGCRDRTEGGSPSASRIRGEW